MASSNFMASLALILVLLAVTVKANDNIPPALAPFFDNLCNEVECGKGTCKTSPGSPFNFVCECDAGWKRTRFDNEENLQYLPCIIPNCTLDYSCMPAAPPAPSVPYNSSLFDPCYWIYCGEGSCTKNATYTHTCQCNPGYQNLMNISVYPCYGECAIGSDCARLGIVSKSSSSSPTSSSSGNGNSQGKFHWISILLISMAMALWK
ncbi:unnamed protein product [Ilex paraguariensis]|uniref:Uncharacterized protein n=1 Tax=Ilex paraguariensis TaxID=185542 RepID=A0ABC8QUD9_9AQUA